MPRQPRPIYRAPPRSHRSVISSQKRSLSSRNRLHKEVEKSSKSAIRDESSGDDEEYSDAETEEEEGSDLRLGNSEGMESDEEDVDAPRVSQWVGEDEFEARDEEGSDQDNEPEAAPQLKKVQNTLSNLPFGTLRKAQHIIGRTEPATDSEAVSDVSDNTDSAIVSDEGTSHHQPSRERNKVEWSAKPRKDIAKRSSKHAPTEVTSKKPVTRFRQIVEVNKMEPRDPRFLPIAGEFKAEKFYQNYDFLTTAHGHELNTLRDNLKRARKMSSNAPRHLQHNYDAEVQRLELAVKRAESTVNKDRADKIQREALQKAHKAEREKRNHGKGSWYMKKSEKRETVSLARYEALAAVGGTQAVKKAIEKRQKKITQKEKKSRPFAKGYSMGDESLKRGFGGSGGARKRRRVG